VSSATLSWRECSEDLKRLYLENGHYKKLGDKSYDLTEIINAAATNTHVYNSNQWTVYYGVVKEVVDKSNVVCVVYDVLGFSDSFTANVKNMETSRLMVDGDTVAFAAVPDGIYSYVSGGSRHTVKALEYGQNITTTNLGTVQLHVEPLGKTTQPEIVVDDHLKVEAQQKEYEARILAAEKAKKDEMDRKVLVYQIAQAQKGVGYAQFELGVRYIKGNGVETNVMTGRDWISKAAAQGESQAVQWLSKNPLK
jgi:hypothetical protein